MDKRYLTEQEIAQIRRSALPVQDALVLSSASFIPFHPKILASLLWCDLADRPDVRDSIRVHCLDGDGSVELTWMAVDIHQPLESVFLLYVNIHRPVRLTFALDINVWDWSALIRTISRSGSLTSLPGPPLNWRELIPHTKAQALLDEIDRQHGAGLLINFRGETQKYLRSLYMMWERNLSSLLRQKKRRP